MPSSADLLLILLLLGFVCMSALFLLVMRSLAAQRELMRETFSRQNLQLAALESRLAEILQALRAGVSTPAGVVPRPAVNQPPADDLGALLEGVDKLPSLDAPFGNNGRSTSTPRGGLDLKLDS